MHISSISNSNIHILKTLIFLGILDGTKVLINPSQKNKDSYIDRKGHFSISVQAVCNENRKFIDIFIGFPGSVHDSRIYKNSPLASKLPLILAGKYDHIK